MSTSNSWMRRASREDGGSAVEYGLLAAGIAGVVAVAVFAFGQSVSGLFVNSCTSISSGSSGRMAPIKC